MQNNIPPGYSLSGISLLARHGTRYPHPIEMFEYHENARYVQRNAQNPPDWLLKWEPVMKDEQSLQLGQSGWNEHQGIASRFSEMNPKLFETPNKIWSSRNARSITSAKAFLAQLFDPDSLARKVLNRLYANFPIKSEKFKTRIVVTKATKIRYKR